MVDLASEIERRVGYRFQDVSLAQKALSHSSLLQTDSYERLEFLGDRVVGLVVATALFRRFPDESEGDLAKRHAALVQGKTLAQLAVDIDLGALILFSDAERAAGGPDNENILADVFESLVGALYLDGGMEAASCVIEDLMGDLVYSLKTPPRDAKTALQEWAQGRGLPLPIYDIVDRTGPDHAPVFEISVSVEGHPPALAAGSSRRSAEKDAATKLLAKLEQTSG